MEIKKKQFAEQFGLRNTAIDINSLFWKAGRVSLSVMGFTYKLQMKNFLKGSYQVYWETVIRFRQILMQKTEVEEDRECDSEKDSIKNP